MSVAAHAFMAPAIAPAAIGRPRQRSPFLSAVDRYLLAIASRWYGIVIALIVAILLIENLPRLLSRLSHVDETGMLILRSLINLVPEYLSLGLPIGLFLAVALTFRRLSMNSELDVLLSTGFSPRRLLRIPIALGLLAGVVQFGIRGFAEPWGEAALEAIGQAVHAGDFGIDVAVHQFIHPSPDSTVYVDRLDQRAGLLHGVFVTLGATHFSAPRARAVLDQDRRIRLTLLDGVALRDTSDGRTQASHFDRFVLRLPAPVPPSPKRLVETPLDSVDDTHLIAELSRHANDPSRQTLLVALNERLLSSLICLLLPWFGFVAGPTAKRSTSAMAIAVGIVAIVAFFKVNVGVVTGLTPPSALIAQLGLAGGLVLAAFAIRQATRVGQPGAMEAALGRSAAAVLARLPSVRPAFRR